MDLSIFATGGSFVCSRVLKAFKALRSEIYLKEEMSGNGWHFGQCALGSDTFTGRLALVLSRRNAKECPSVAFGDDW